METSTRRQGGGRQGCGKTHLDLAKAVAGELDVSYFQVSALELVGGVSGESELRADLIMCPCT